MLLMYCSMDDSSLYNWEVDTTNRKDGRLVFNGRYSTESLIRTIRSYNLLYKQISFIYCSIEEGCTL